MSQMLPQKRQQSLKLQQTARRHHQWLQPYSDVKVDPSYWRKDFIPIETGSMHSKGMGQHHCPHEEQPVSGK